MSNSNEEGVNRLLAEQANFILSSQARSKQLNQFKEDYHDLDLRLENMPKKVTHPVMLPFSSKALVPGKIIRTNEVHAYIGTDHFIHMSIYEARGMVARRLTKLNSQIQAIEEETRLIQSQSHFTDDIRRQSHEEVEIKEDYNPEVEKKWRTRHKEHLRANKSGDRSSLECHDDTALMHRLEELEREELTMERYASPHSQRRSSLKNVNEVNRESKQVHFSDVGPSQDSKVPDSDDDNEITPASKVITFRHSLLPVGSALPSMEVPVTSPGQLTPGHVTLLTGTGSCLVPDRSQPCGSEECDPCTDLVIDREQISTGSKIETVDTDSKPVSRFKAMRQAKSTHR